MNASGQKTSQLAEQHTYKYDVPLSSGYGYKLPVHTPTLHEAALIFSRVSGCLVNLNPKFTLLLALVCSPPAPQLARGSSLFSK